MSQAKKILSVVSPVYYGEHTSQELVDRIISSTESLDYNVEIILVEDGSPDQSWESISRICAANNHVKGIKLSRNFGQHYAITAGLSESKGDLIVVMDCDLQDRPEEIPNLIAKSKEGFDIVFAQRVLRNDGFIKRFFSKQFYNVFGYLTDTVQDATIANFGVYSRSVIDAVLSMGDKIRYFPTMTQWVGFEKAKINVEHSERSEGESTYSWGSLIQLALDNIVSFSDKPLRLTIKLGLIISIMSIGIGVYYLVLSIIGKIVVSGFASLIISIWFLSGLIIFVLGVIALYLGKTFDQIKNRPTFIIEKKIN